MADRGKRGEDENTKVWISQEWKDLFRWNKKHFSHSFWRAIIWWEIKIWYKIADISLKGCIHYIFASLFFMSTWNKEKLFSFHFESSFCFGDNQISTSQIFKSHDVIKYLSMKHKALTRALQVK